MPVNDNYGLIPLLVHESNICASSFLMFYKNKSIKLGPITAVCGCFNKMCGFNPLWNMQGFDNVTMHAAYNAICEERGVLNYDKCDSVLGRKFNIYNVLLRAVLYSSDAMLYSRLVNKLDNSMKTMCNYPVPDGCLVLDGHLYDSVIDVDIGKNSGVCIVKYGNELNEGKVYAKVSTAVDELHSIQQKTEETKTDIVENDVELLSRVDVSDSVKGEKLVKEELDKISKDRCSVCKRLVSTCICPDPMGNNLIKDERFDREGILLPIVKLVDCVSKCISAGRSWEISYDFCGMNGTSSVALEAYTGSSGFVNLQIDISVEGREIGEIKRNLIFGQSIRSVMQNTFVNEDKVQSLKVPSLYVPHDRVHYKASGFGKEIMTRSMFVRTTNSIMVQYFKCAIGSITADHFRRLSCYENFKSSITPHYWQSKPKFVQMLLGMGYKLPNFVSHNKTVAVVGTVKVPAKFKKKKSLI